MKEIIFCGENAHIYDFPKQTRIFYANPPLKPLRNDKEAINSALDNPIESKRIEDLINGGSRVAICFDDVSVPLPAMKDDVRAKAAEVVLERLSKIGVKKENIMLICATGLHRKCRPKELIHMLGKKVYYEYKNQIFNHDVEDKENLKVLGTTEEGYEVEINKLAADADLIIYLSITFTPLNGGWKSIVVGLGTYKSIIIHHSPEVLKEGPFMDPKSSEMHRIIWEMGHIIRDKINIFTIEMVLNNNFFSGFLDKIYHPLGENNQKVPIWRRLALSILKITPRFIKSYVMRNLKADYRLLGVYTGDIENAHIESLKLVKKQLNVPIDKQYDVLIYGVPSVTPYNVGSVMNPLLLRTLLFGYLCNMYNGRPPLKKDGIIIISNPVYGKFDKKEHPSYFDFFYDVLAKNPDVFQLKNIQELFLNNKEYSKKYSTGYAYHGTHALMVYYWGTLGYLNVGEVIVAGAKNKEILKILGYDYAINLDDAINICKEKKGKDCSIAYFCIPPIFISELRNI